MGNVLQRFLKHNDDTVSESSTETVPDSNSSSSSLEIDSLTSAPTEETIYERVIRKPEILERLIFFAKKTLPQNKTYNLEILQTKNREYEDVSKIFLKNNKKCFTVEKIEKIHNPYLLTQYSIAKKKYKQLKINVKEKVLFHGTSISNVDGICKNNFNWRLEGTNIGHKFGKGVSFSPFAYYATNYSDRGDKKIMIAATVLVGPSWLGKKDIAVPPKGYDTTTDGKEQVFVKFDDNTFYPAYLISYNGSDPDKEDDYVPRRRSTRTLSDFLSK